VIQQQTEEAHPQKQASCERPIACENLLLLRSQLLLSRSKLLGILRCIKLSHKFFIIRKFFLQLASCVPNRKKANEISNSRREWNLLNPQNFTFQPIIKF